MTSDTRDVRLTEQPIARPTVRPARPGDVDVLCEIQTEVLPDDLLSCLGHRFLADCFFPAVIAQRGFTTLVLEIDNEAQGFIILADHERAVRRAVAANSHRCILPMLAALLRRPATSRSILCYLGKRTELTGEGAAILARPYHEIVAFSLRVGARGRGWGAQLLDEASRSSAGTTLPIIACSASADGLRFYAKQGFRHIGTQYRCDKALEVMVRP